MQYLHLIAMRRLLTLTVSLVLVFIGLTAADISARAAAEEDAVFCTKEYIPVCGADGMTYGNACEARAAGQTSYTPGACPVAGEPGGDADDTVADRAAAAGITRAELAQSLTRYRDVTTDHFASGYLARLTRDGVLAGYPDGTLRPDVTINRAELAKIAVKTCDPVATIETDQTPAWSDVPAGEWYASSASQLFVAEALPATWQARFGGATDVTRAEAIYVLGRAAGVSFGATPTAQPFPDVGTASPYAAAIAWAQAQGVISGYEDGTFGPSDTLTRAQLAKMAVLIEQLP